MDKAEFIKRLKGVNKTSLPRDFPSLIDKHIVMCKPHNADIGENECHILMEECGELIQSVSKILRHTKTADVINLVEEMGDVMVSIAYVAEVFHIPDEAIIGAMNVKVDRLRNIVSGNANEEGE